MSNFVLFWAALLILCSQVQADPAASKGFYPGDPNIIELRNDNFASVLRRPNTAHLVEFYMSWCGHCRAFAPVFRRFAKSVSGWKSAVKVAAINCASEQAKATCQSQGIAGVPTLKYFPAKTGENAGKSFPAFRSVRKLKAGLLQKIIDEDRINPVIDFRLLEDDDHRILYPRTPLVALVVDDTNSSIPFELVLELNSHPQLSVFRAAPDHPWLAKLDVEEIPSIVFFRNGEAVDQAGFKSILRSAILEYVDGVVTTHSPGFVTPSSVVDNATMIAPVTDMNMFFASESDMLQAVRETLEDEVPFKGGMLTKDQIIALENYLEALKEYFPTQSIVTPPGEASRIQDLVRSRKAVKLFGYLLRWLKMERSLGNQVSTTKWSTIFATLKKSHDDPFPKGDWQHCKGSTDNYRGYTCGLWSVFHAMTVKSYIKNRNADTWNPRSAMNAIRGYIENFFGCTYCRAHFLQMSANMTEEIVKKEDSFMWLWQAHNQVNTRLAGDETEDPAFPKRQFPPSFLCPTCKTAKNGQWINSEVIRFMLQYYTSVRPVGA